MHTSKHLLVGVVTVAFLVGVFGLVLPPPSHALETKDGFQLKKILKAIFPPCGPGTKQERFVVKGEKVCDNKTGLWWQGTPGEPPDANCGNTDTCTWQEAKDYCEALELTGKHSKEKQWRLAEVKELISLVDYSVVNQAANLNAPNGPFMNVQSSTYWSATELAVLPTSAWDVDFNSGRVSFIQKGNTVRAWCVSGEQDGH